MAGIELLIARGQRRAEELCGARLLWPETIGGDGFPCSTSELVNAKRLNDQGGGLSLFDDAIITLRAEHFVDGGGNVSRPQENQGCRFKPGPDEDWRAMKIASVQVQPGGRVLELRLNSRNEGV